MTAPWPRSDPVHAFALSTTGKYVLTHPESEHGNPNVADQDGYDLVTVRPDGLMIYRRKSWIRRRFFKRKSR